MVPGFPLPLPFSVLKVSNIGEVAADALAETLKENLTTPDDSLMSEYPTRQGSISCTKILYDH